MAIKVLIVDDSVFVRQILSKILKTDTRFQVIGTAFNGKDALAKIKELEPDVITLDIEMPILNGLETLAMIMSQKPIPVIMLSSLTKKGAKETVKALESGAIDFITKPEGMAGRNLDKIALEIKEKLILAAHSVPRKLRNINYVSTKRNLDNFTKKSNTKVVVIGTSTGGPSALSEVIGSLPSNISVPIFVVQHMPIGFTKLLAERLNNISQLKVKEAENNEAILPGHIYVIPAGFHINLSAKGTQKIVNLTDRAAITTSFKPSIDVVMFEAVKEYGKQVLGVVLTGMGSDGLKGAKAIKSAGGNVIVEAKESCVVYGMPKVIVEAELADEIIPIGEVCNTILKYI